MKSFSRSAGLKVLTTLSLGALVVSAGCAQLRLQVPGVSLGAAGAGSSGSSGGTGAASPGLLQKGLEDDTRAKVSPIVKAAAGKILFTRAQKDLGPAAQGDVVTETHFTEPVFALAVLEKSQRERHADSSGSPLVSLYARVNNGPWLSLGWTPTANRVLVPINGGNYPFSVGFEGLKSGVDSSEEKNPPPLFGSTSNGVAQRIHSGWEEMNWKAGVNDVELVLVDGNDDSTVLARGTLKVMTDAKSLAAYAKEFVPKKGGEAFVDAPKVVAAAGAEKSLGWKGFELVGLHFDEKDWSINRTELGVVKGRYVHINLIGRRSNGFCEVFPRTAYQEHDGSRFAPAVLFEEDANYEDGYKEKSEFTKALTSPYPCKAGVKVVAKR